MAEPVIFLSGVIEIANTFISLFALIYAYMFLRKTTKHRDRRPWEFLVVAAILFFSAQATKVFEVMAATNLFGLDNFFQLLFVSFLLLSFIVQHNLFQQKEMVLIYKKVKETKEK